ncbi:MAG: hypothetical protein GY757_54430 [bacterium]|nr:hypothetical protein [bacterium]
MPIKGDRLPDIGRNKSAIKTITPVRNPAQLPYISTGHTIVECSSKTTSSLPPGNNP